MSPRSVVVTGASTGIGRATVLELVSARIPRVRNSAPGIDAEGLRRQFPEVVTPVESWICSMRTRCVPLQRWSGPTDHCLGW